MFACFQPKTGILAIMDEECMIPEATEKSFSEKLNANHLGKTPVFVKPKPPAEGQAETHFTIVHYGGSVSYNLTGWLEKNKDPLNDSLVDLLKNSSNELCASLFTVQQEPPPEAPQEEGEEKSGESIVLFTFFNNFVILFSAHSFIRASGEAAFLWQEDYMTTVFIFQRNLNQNQNQNRIQKPRQRQNLSLRQQSPPSRSRP